MPQVLFGQPTWMPGVLDAVEARIAESVPIDRGRVISHAGEPDDLLQYPPANKFAAVWFQDLSFDSRSLEGGLPWHMPIEGRLRIDLFSQLGTDQEFRDAKMLRDRSRGLSEFVKSVTGGLAGWVREQAGTSIFQEPPRPLKVEFNPRRPKTGWAWARLLFSVKFRASFGTDLAT